MNIPISQSLNDATENIPFIPKFIKIYEIEGIEFGDEQSWIYYHNIWQALDTLQRDKLVNYLFDKACTFGPVYFHLGDKLIKNDYIKAQLDNCKKFKVAAWLDDTLSIATIMWLMESSTTLLTELNTRTLTLSKLKQFFQEKYTKYCKLCDLPPEPLPLVDLCQSVFTLRQSIEKNYIRCFHIDGKEWQRNEYFLRREECDIPKIYPHVCQKVAQHTGLTVNEIPLTQTAVDKLIDEVIAKNINPFEIIVAITNAAVEDDFLKADYSVITVPYGVLLDAPWKLSIEQICCYVAIREGVDTQTNGAKLNNERVKIAIAQRMRFNIVKRTRIYHPEQKQRITARPFRFPDIAQNENSHYNGHINAGIKTSARTHFLLASPYKDIENWRGLGDLRINRLSDNKPYTLEELKHLLPYGRLCQLIYNATISKGLYMDQAYCKKK